MWNHWRVSYVLIKDQSDFVITSTSRNQRTHKHKSGRSLLVFTWKSLSFGKEFTKAMQSKLITFVALLDITCVFFTISSRAISFYIMYANLCLCFSKSLDPLAANSAFGTRPNSYSQIWFWSKFNLFLTTLWTFVTSFALPWVQYFFSLGSNFQLVIFEQSDLSILFRLKQRCCHQTVEH